MNTPPGDLLAHFHQYEQNHVFAHWDKLSAAERSSLVAQLQALDLNQLRQLHSERATTFSLPSPEGIAPAPVVRSTDQDDATRQLGEELLRAGKVAVLLVAGGQGSRLGFERPKGMYSVGPVSGKTLFQIHAEKVLALRRRYGRPIPYLVMTSDATHAETVAYFAQHDQFGLPAGEVYFFQQGTMPALSLDEGKLLLEAPGRLFTSPNGHGGTLTALAECGLLAHLQASQIEEVFYFQVDNPLAKIADAVFLGIHRRAQAEVSTKVVAKRGPDERTGNVVAVDGRCTIIEYSDLPKALAEQRDARGELRISAANTAIHLFNVAFLARVIGTGSSLPYHIAQKKVPHVDAAGRRVEPERENALKFERFIFDVLPLADRWTVVETPRAEEFEPLKNAAGANSPESVRRAMIDLAATWLRQAGVAVPATAAVEISPLFALDPEELSAKIRKEFHVDGICYLS